MDYPPRGGDPGPEDRIAERLSHLVPGMTLPAPSPAIRVLLVDDDALVRETLTDQLEMLGFAILPAACGAEALALLDTGAGVDVLLSDLSMPGIDGIETIRQARQRRPALPCTLLTGYAGSRLSGADTSGFLVLRKPIAGEALGAHLRARIDECRAISAQA